MKKQRILPRLILVFALAPLTMSCDQLSSLLPFFGNGVMVEFINDTDYTVVPDLRISDSKNFFEDLFDEGERVTNFGFGGAIRPNARATVQLVCNGDLEQIALLDADFEDGSGIKVGDLDDTTRLRRDVNFDCGDIVQIRFHGSVFNFDAEVDVDETALSDSARDSDDDDDDDWADRLEDVFGDLFD